MCTAMWSSGWWHNSQQQCLQDMVVMGDDLFLQRHPLLRPTCKDLLEAYYIGIAGLEAFLQERFALRPTV